MGEKGRWELCCVHAASGGGTGQRFQPPRALDTAAQHPGSVAGLAIKFLQDFDPFSGGEMKQLKQIRLTFLRGHEGSGGAARELSPRGLK